MANSKKRRRRTSKITAFQAQRPQSAHGPFQHGEDFVFELRGKRTQIMDSQLIDALRTRAAAVGRPFSMREFDDWPGRPCSACTIQVRFGDWRRALALAGIEGGRRSNYTPEELIQNLESAWRAMGRAPGHHTIRLHSTVGPGPYIRVWGGVRRACLLFSRYKRGQISRRALLRPSPKRRRKAMSSRARWQILERDGHRCTGCGRSSREPGVRLEVDHIHPVSAGGPNDAANLRALCQDCNRGKGGEL